MKCSDFESNNELWIKWVWIAVYLFYRIFLNEYNYPFGLIVIKGWVFLKE